MNAEPQYKWPARLALGLIMAGPLLVIDRGFDLADSGFYLFNYRYAFTWPEVNSLTMILSNWLGGLIYALLPETGLLLAYKLICVGLYALVTWFSYVILRDHFPIWLNLLALALANALTLAFVYNTSYNTFSYLFLSLAILLLYRGLSRDRPLFMYAAAVILALNAFVRLPNILQWGLAAVPFWYYWFCLGRRRRAVSVGLRFTLALLLAWLVFLVLCSLAQGPQWLDRELGGLTGIMFKSKAHHSAFAMWDLYDVLMRDGWGMFWQAALRCAPLSLALAAGLAVLRRRRVATPLLAAVGLASGVALAYYGGFLYEVYIFRGPAWSYPVRALCLLLAAAGLLVPLAGLLWYHQRRPLLSALSAVVIIIFLAQSFGSDFSVLHYLYYTHLSLAVVLGLAWRLWLDAAAWLGAKWPRSALTGLGPALGCANVFFWFLLAFSLFSFDDLLMDANHGDFHYGAATAEVPGVPALAGMKTHPARAFWLGYLAKKLAPYGERPLVVMGHCSLCHFLSESPPLLPAPWQDLYSLPPEGLSEGLERAAGEGRLPLVLIVDEFDLWSLGWRHSIKEKILKFFMERQRYTLAVESPAFKLYLPPGLGPEGPPVAFFKPRPAPGSVGE